MINSIARHTARLALALALLGAPVAPAHADIRVPQDFPTIQEAINFSSDGDTVVLADGTYTGAGNNNLIVDRNITIRSASGFEGQCIIRADPAFSPVITIRHSVAPKIQGLIIQSRDPEGEVQGAILIEGGSPTIGSASSAV
jgi:hypothetical protein